MELFHISWKLIHAIARAQQSQSRTQRFQSEAQQFQSQPQRFQNPAQQNPNAFIRQFNALGETEAKLHQRVPDCLDHDT
jgi:hypothetical protein